MTKAALFIKLSQQKELRVAAQKGRLLGADVYTRSSFE